MRKQLTALVLGLGLAFPAAAEEIKTRDTLVSYLKEHMPDGQEISYTFQVDDTLKAGQNVGGCLSARTLQQLRFIPRLLVTRGLMHLQVTKEEQGYGVIGGSAMCEYRVSHFNLYELELFGARIEPSDGLSGKVTIPLVKQRVLGVTKADFDGYTSVGNTSCDIAFRVWFESYEPSTFVKELKPAFLKEHAYKNVFNSEFETSTWCLQYHYDGTYKWKVWSRL